MSQLSLSTLPLAAHAKAVALGNPPNLFPSCWTPLRPAKFSSFYATEMLGLEGDAPLTGGSTSFVVDADYQVFGSGAALTISYERNTDVPECAENAALDGINMGLSSSTVDLILSRVQTKPGYRTHVEFRTLPNGSFHVEAFVGPFNPGAQVLPNPVSFPSVPLSSLRCTHQLASSTHIFLVKISSDVLSDEVRVFKTSRPESSLVEEVEFMSRLPDSDFVLRPTHIVTDDAGVFHGLLSNYHPASSLCRTMDSLHPEIDRPVLAPTGVDRSVRSLAATVTESVSWSVKLTWAIDVAASVAWLHAQAMVGVDLKTDNIVLCTDGHCRLIDCSPEGETILWCPPEAQQPDWRGTEEGDVFALGLVLWAVAEEVGTFEREQDYTSPLLSWSQGIPPWFQRLASSCLERDPGRRPSVRCVYETLMNKCSIAITT
ncbi:kinase-like domain-containing protein [Mycena filopes]|nr:kinase-like domain-containing protein [Mycena filopes]